MSLTTGQIAEMTAGELCGPGDLRIDSLETLELAGAHQLTFIGDQKYAGAWADCSAKAALVARAIDVAPGDGRAVIRVDDADLAVATVLDAIARPTVVPEPGVHESAVIAASAHIADGVTIGPHCVIGDGVRIGPGCVLHANVSILDEAVIGHNGLVWPGAVIRERCTIGDNCIIHANATIGADGFAYRPSTDGRSLVKLSHVGTVRIGDDVEIGAGSCIDRGKFSATTVGDGTKIDNLVQIAHNCRIGRSVVIAGGCGIAGSIEIGDGAMLGGMVGIRDHVSIGPGATLAACAQVMSDVPAGETWGGSPAQELRAAIREVVAIRKLPDLMKQLKKQK